jgi:hypothetical protein
VDAARAHGHAAEERLTGGDWDEEKLAKKAAGDQISYLMGMMVGLRDIAGAAQAATGTSEFNTGYGGPAGARFLGELYKLAQQAHQGEADAAFLKALNNVGGILFHLPQRPDQPHGGGRQGAGKATPTTRWP